MRELPIHVRFSNRPFGVKHFQTINHYLSDHPPLQCRCRSRARASLRNRHQGPSLIGRLGSSAFKPSATTFQTIHYCSVDVAHGLALLFGIGTKALPLWDSRTRRNNLLGDLAVRVTAGSSDITNSPHPSSREGHLSTAVGRPCRQSDSRFKRHYELTSSIVPRGTSFHGLVELEFSPIVFDPARFSCCCRGLFPGPAELSAINPYAVHDHGQPTRQRHDRLFHSAAPGDLHRPGLEPGPSL